jgi:hypothetical protein
LISLISDASNDEILRLKKFLDAELNLRGQEIEIALWEREPPTYVTYLPGFYFRDVYLHEAIFAWLKETDYGGLRGAQHNALASSLKEDFEAVLITMK